MNIKIVKVVFEFNIDDSIVLTVGSKVKEIQKIYNAKVQTINVPKIAPPDVPRLILIFENMVLNICLNRYEYQIEIPSHVNNDIESSFRYVRSKIFNIYKFLDLNNDVYKWTGVIVNIEYPSQDMSSNVYDYLIPLFERIINIDRQGKSLGAFQLNFGYREDGKFFNYAISGYETRSLEINAKQSSGFVQIHQDDGIVTEYGISVTVDINNRPSNNHIGAIEELDIILNDLNNAIVNIPNTLNIRGIINE